MKLYTLTLSLIQLAIALLSQCILLFLDLWHYSKWVRCNLEPGKFITTLKYLICKFFYSTNCFLPLRKVCCTYYGCRVWLSILEIALLKKINVCHHIGDTAAYRNQTGSRTFNKLPQEKLQDSYACTRNWVWFKPHYWDYKENLIAGRCCGDSQGRCC